MKRSKIASLIYHVSRNKGDGLGYSQFNENNPLNSVCISKTPSDPKVIFVNGRTEDLDISEPGFSKELPSTSKFKHGAVGGIHSTCQVMSAILAVFKTCKRKL
jgi:hypothetical protein